MADSIPGPTELAGDPRRTFESAELPAEAAGRVSIPIGQKSRGRRDWVLRRFRPEELLATPFLVLVAALYGTLSLTPRLMISFNYYTLVLVALYVELFALVRVWEHARSRRPTAELWVSLRRIQYLTLLRDWAPWMIILLIYENLHDLVPYLAGPDRDSSLIAVDRALFGEVHVTIWLERFVSPELTTVMVIVYFSFFFYPAILGIALYRKADKSGWRVLLLGMSLVAFSGFTLYILVPAVGPMRAMSDAYSVDLQRRAMASAASTLHETFRVSRDVFPSLHVGMTTLYLLIAWRFARRLFWILLPFIAALWFSTLYLRYHYVIDLIAGMALAVVAYVVSIPVGRRWYLACEHERSGDTR